MSKDDMKKGLPNETSSTWGGRFSSGTAPLVEEYTSSVGFDRHLYAQDIAGSRAHALMMARQGIITREESDKIVNGLDTILQEIEQGTFTWKSELEDVHMNIESRLIELIGPAGQKLHTGRSRNDQVALDFRLYVSKALSNWEAELKGLIKSLTDQARKHEEFLLPGCTHLQPAQPVSLAHHLLAYVQMFIRDVERIRDCQKRVRVSPLGAAALGGTTHSLDPEMVAREVGFEKVFENSMDAVSDRDFVAESIFCASLIMVHLSRLCEEIIIWANPAFDYIRLPDRFATGSSIMPQKKNPDVAEIMRGKSGRVFGDLISLLTLLKGLPMTYNRDLQEDKEPFLDADATVHISVKIMSEMMAALTFNRKAMEDRLTTGYLNATELADYLVEKGVPFRQAHHITGRIVAYAEKKGKGLEELSVEEMQTFSEFIDQSVYRVLDFKTAVSRRGIRGGTGPSSVQLQLVNVGKWLETTSTAVPDK